LNSGQVVGPGLGYPKSFKPSGPNPMWSLVHPESSKPPPKKKKKNGKCQITPISFDVTKK